MADPGAENRRPDGFRERGANVTRFEAFVDAAFAFAVTLLVISLDGMPASISELMDALKRAEKARQKLGPRRGGGRVPVRLDEAHDVIDPRAEEILLIHDALEALNSESPVKAELVKLRYFGGLSHQEAAKSLGISRATADRYWTYAKAYLFAAIQDE